MASNPYAAPRADVRDLAVEYQGIRMWSPGGRIGRLRYLAYTFGASLLVGACAGVLVAVAGALGAVLAVALYAVAVVFTIIAAIQRSHDMNWTGWTVLLMLIPLVALVWIFKPGTEGENRFGAPPPPNTTGVKILAFMMPVIFVIGVVAAIAIPAYQDYTQRALGGG